jgi:cobalt-zinc-cadmium efflux system membrane fusion protein
MVFGLMILAFSACQPAPSDHDNHDHHDHESHDDHDHGEHEDIVMLTAAQGRALGLEIGSLTERVMKGSVRANGEVSLPPQQQASVSTIRSAYISSIKVIEGDKVAKAQVLCALQHPDIIRLQTEYLKVKSQLRFLDLEYARIDTLSKRKITAQREFEKIKTDREIQQIELANLEQQLGFLGEVIKTFFNSKKKLRYL